MLRWFRRTYSSYNLQPLLLKRYRELEEARAFNNWLGKRRQAQEGQRHLDDVSRLTSTTTARTVSVHDLLKGREYNRNKAMEGFNEVNNPHIARAVRPTMVGILRCGKMLPPQLNLVMEIEFADATTALWSENAGAHPAGATLSTDFEMQNVQVLAFQVVLDSALVESLLPGGLPCRFGSGASGAACGAACASCASASCAGASCSVGSI